MRPILSSSVASLIAPCFIGRPTPAFGDDTQGRAAAEDKPTVQLGLHDQVAGEEPPDFSFIDGESAPASSAETPPAAPEVKPASPEPPAAPEPAKGTPATRKVADPNDELEVPPVQPAKETGDQPMPDPKAEADKAAAEKKAAEDQAVTDKAAADKKAVDDKAAADKAAAEGKQPEVKLPTEEELEAMQPKPGAPARVIADFKKLKDEVVKPALAEVKRLRTELETTKAQAEKALTPEIEEKLKQAEEDRIWRQAFELQNDPRLQQEFKVSQEKVEGDLYAVLGRFGMKPEALEEIKKVGLGSEKGREYRNNILERAREALDPIAFDEVKDAFKAVDADARTREARINELRGSQESLAKAKEEHEIKERTGWAEVSNDHIIEAVKGDEDFLLKDVPANATPEEKAAIEAHNKEVSEQRVPQMHEGIRAIWTRDPEKTMKMMVASIRLPRVEAQLAAQKADFEKKLADADARIKELEGDTGRMKRVSSPSRTDNAPPADGRSTAPDTSHMTAEEAADAYAREKGIGQGYRVA